MLGRSSRDILGCGPLSNSWANKVQHGHWDVSSEKDHLEEGISYRVHDIGTVQLVSRGGS